MREFEEFKEFIPQENKANNNIEKTSLAEYLPSVCLTIVLVILSGLGTIVQYSFDFKNIVWSTFIVSLSLRLVTIFSAKYVGSNLFYNKEMHSENVVKIKTELSDVGKDIDKSDLDKYVNTYNFESKKKAYKTKIRSKIAKREQKVNKLKFKNELLYKKRREKLISRHNKKIEELKAISSDEYVEKNIRYIKVKYKKVRPCYFFSFTENNSVKDRYYNVNVSTETSKEIIKSLPLTIFITILGSTMVFSATTGTLNLLSFFYDLTMIMFNFVLGWFVVGKKVLSATISAYINRIIFLKEYKNKNESKTKEVVAMATENVDK